jgi:SAM-dependent methyltransferase
MAQRVDFDRQAPVYDQLHGAILPADTAAQLAKAASLQDGSVVLDVGAGTGRVAIALAQLDYEVVAIDPSAAMLDGLRAKAAELRPRIVRGDASALPFKTRIFDAVVIARLLYLVVDWKEVLSEMWRMLKPGGRLLHEWGNGTEDEPWVQIREHARFLFERAGVELPFHPGARTEAQVEEELRRLGFERLQELKFASGAMLLSKFLEGIRTGRYTYTWNVPAAIQAECLPQLESWAAGNFDLSESVLTPREIIWTIYSKGAE